MVFATTIQTFDFGAGAVNATWEGKGSIKMQQMPNGILLQTTGTGLFVTDNQLTISPDFGSVTVSAQEPTDAYFVWIYDSDQNQTNYDIPISVPAGANIVTQFQISGAQNWYAANKKLGIVLKPNSTILLHQIRFDALNPAERLLETIKSFWTFDRYRTYSINFLWGPQVASNPLARQSLFSVLPPPTTSWTYVINIGLLILIVLLILRARFSQSDETKRKALLIGCVLVAAVWIVFDLREGSEFLSYVSADHTSYIAASDATRTFRDRDRFYDFAAFAAPYVFDRESYIFFAEQQWPYLGNMRYLTYPAIPGIDFDHDDTWVIYHRSDVGLNEANQLTIEGEPVSQPGKILGRFDESSFVFRTFQKPAPTLTL